jgi:hypothetical protein
MPRRKTVSQWSRQLSLATILGIEMHTPIGRQIASVFIDASGEVRGHQSKVQLDPSEEAHYVAGRARRLFEVSGVKQCAGRRSCFIRSTPAPT